MAHRLVEPHPMDASAPPSLLMRERLLQGAVLILATLSLVAAQLAPQGDPDSTGAAETTTERLELLLQARYSLGVALWLQPLGLGDAQTDSLFDALDRAATTPQDNLRLVPVVAAAGRLSDARTRLGQLPAELPDDIDWAMKVAAMDAALLRLEAPAHEAPTHDAPPLASEERDRLLTLDWFGELAVALVDDHGAAEPLGAALPILRASTRLAQALLAGLLLALLAFGVGCTLALIAFIAWREGRLTSGYRRLTSDSRYLTGDQGEVEGQRLPFLESLVLFILALQVLGLVSASLMAEDGGRWPLLVNWLALAVLAWPLWRGLPAEEVRAAVGWTTGGGWREVVAGIAGYLAAAPLLALGFLLTVLVAQVGEQQPYHPILDWVEGAGTLDLLIIASAAVIWAPVVEESLFRGAFFHYLRGKLGVLASATLVALTFAALHPQGLAGLPFLISLAIALALIREWRGSLIAPITVHVIHNGLIMGLMFVVWS